MNNILISIVGISTTLVIYTLSGLLYKRFSRPFTMPILVSTILLILGLLIFNVSYESFHISTHWLEKLLGPAVVALAYPLYQHRKILKEHSFTVLVSVTIGTVLGIASGLFMGMLLNLNHMIIASLLPKSVTTPVAMDITKSIGGEPALAAVMVMIAGLTGAIFGPSLFKWLGIKHYLAKGIGMGSASHAIGTSKAMENSSEEGAVSTIAMLISAIMVSLIHPIVTYLL